LLRQNVSCRAVKLRSLRAQSSRLIWSWGGGSPSRRKWHFMAVGSQLHSYVALPTGQVLSVSLA